MVAPGGLRKSEQKLASKNRKEKEKGKKACDELVSDLVGKISIILATQLL